MNLDELLKIAEAARCLFLLQQYETGSSEAKYIAAFNPTVAKALVKVAMAAEAQRKGMTSGWSNPPVQQLDAAVDKALANLRAAYAVDLKETK